MENVEERDTPTSVDDALASIEAVNRAQADLADRLVTPWWYHPGLGLIEATFVVSMGLPTWWRLAAVVVAIAGLGVLVRAYSRLTGLGMSWQYARQAGGWVMALVVIVLAALAVVLLVGHPLVTAAAAVVVFVATVVLGRRTDRAIRDRLRRGVGSR